MCIVETVDEEAEEAMEQNLEKLEQANDAVEEARLAMEAALAELMAEGGGLGLLQVSTKVHKARQDPANETDAGI